MAMFLVNQFLKYTEQAIFAICHSFVQYQMLEEREQLMSQTVSALIQSRELIPSAKLRAGDRVSEQVLVKKLRVSRTPIRAALRRLESGGLCRIAKEEDMKLIHFLSKKSQDAINVRGALEGMAAEECRRTRTNGVWTLRHLKN